jgi:DNA-binding response OmpR family regulator
MPGMSGFEVARQLQQQGCQADIIMLTSSGERGDGRRCLELGIGGYLTKPVPQEELLATLCQLRGEPGDNQPGWSPATACRKSNSSGMCCWWRTTKSTRSWPRPS